MVSPQNEVWTLKHVANTEQIGASKKTLTSKQSIPPASMHPEPSIFNEFHDLLSRAYGIEKVVSKGEVLSIRPQEIDEGQPIFEVLIQVGYTRRTVKTRRVVCAFGPMLRP